MAHPNDEAVRALLRERGVAGHVMSGGAFGLLAQWAEFVESVEKGYPFGLADYRNDLDTRTLIAVTGLADEVGTLDARFKAMLTGSPAEVWSSDVPHAFWVRGFPRNAGGELLADLKAEGFV